MSLCLLFQRRKRIIGMFPRSLPFILLMSHASKLLQTLFLKHNYNLKKKNKHLSKIWSKSLSPVKDRDLKLQARGKCTSLSLDLLNKQLSTISINITVIISFCMVYKMFVQSKIQTRQTPLTIRCRQGRKLMMWWQCDKAWQVSNWQCVTVWQSRCVAGGYAGVGQTVRREEADWLCYTSAVASLSLSARVSAPPALHHRQSSVSSHVTSDSQCRAG